MNWLVIMWEVKLFHTPVTPKMVKVVRASQNSKPTSWTLHRGTHLQSQPLGDRGRRSAENPNPLPQSGRGWLSGKALERRCEPVDTGAQWQYGDTLKTEKEKSKEKVAEGHKKGWGAKGLEEKPGSRKGGQKGQARGPLPPTHCLVVCSLWADRLCPGIQAVTLWKGWRTKWRQSRNQRCSQVSITSLILSNNVLSSFYKTREI